MRVWVARNKCLFEAKVSIYKEKPCYDKGIYFSSRGYITEIDIKNFKYLFGFTPRKASCKALDLNLDETQK